MAGIGFEKGLGAGHSMSHAIGALHDIHHGVLNATLLPACLEFNQAQISVAQAACLASAAGISPSDGRSPLDQLTAWARDLNEAFSIPPRLRELGVPAEDRERLIELALADHCHKTNPRRCEKADMDELWERAW